jgi:hypothetical protein
MRHKLLIREEKKKKNAQEKYDQRVNHKYKDDISIRIRGPISVIGSKRKKM